MVQLGEHVASGAPMTHPALMGWDTEDVDGLFSDAWQEGERQLKHGSLRLEIRSLFSRRTTQRWSQDLGKVGSLHPWGFHTTG